MEIGWKHGGLLAVPTEPEEGVLLDRLLAVLKQLDFVNEIALDEVDFAELFVEARGGEDTLSEDEKKALVQLAEKSDKSD